MNNFQLPPNYALKVKHLHPGNSTRADRKGSKYRTLAFVVKYADDNSKKYTIVAMGDAMCGRRDQPVRKLGYLIAVGRALKYFYSL